MAVIRKASDGQLYIRSQFHLYRLLGLLFCFGGFYPLYKMLENGIALEPRLGISLIIMTCIGLLGVSALFNRWSSTISKGRKEVTTASGPFGIGFSNSFHYSENATVKLDTIHKMFLGRTREYYVISIDDLFSRERSTEGLFSIKDIFCSYDVTGEVVYLEEYVESRAVAEALSEFTGLALADHTSGNLVVRRSDCLNLSLKERLLVDGEVPSFYSLAHSTKMSCEAVGSGYRIALPPEGFTSSAVFEFGLVLLVAVFGLGVVIDIFDGPLGKIGTLPNRLLCSIFRLLLYWSMGLYFWLTGSGPYSGAGRKSSSFLTS